MYEYEEVDEETGKKFARVKSNNLLKLGYKCNF